MTIILVSSEFPFSREDATGGIGTYLVNLSSVLSEQGHKVIIITSKVGKFRYKKIEVICCSLGDKTINRLKKTFPFMFIKRLLNFIQYPLLFSLGTYLKIREINRKTKIDIIEGSDFGGELFFHLLLNNVHKPPVVIRLHTPSFVIQRYNDEPLTLFYRAVKFLEIFCLKTADGLYSPSKSLASIVSQAVGRKVTKVIPYPFAPSLETRRNTKANIILYVGKLQPKKGVFLLIESIPLILKAHPSIKFIFAGPDTLFEGRSVKKMMVNILKKTNCIKSVSFLGNIGKIDLKKLYLKSQVLVTPSYWDNYPNVVLEGMSYKVPIVASRVAGLIEIIKHNVTGLLFRSGSQDDLTKQINRLLMNGKLRNILSRNAHEWIINNLNYDKIGEQTISYYLSLK